MFVDVILPLPFSELYTYALSSEMEGRIARGYRVIVPFGSKKYYTAIVIRVHDRAPEKFKTKEIHSVIDSSPVVNEQQLRLWEWISSYYLSPLGDVYKAALPPVMQPEGLDQKFKPKTELFVRITAHLNRDNIPETIGRARKQQSLFDEISHHLSGNNLDMVSKKVVVTLTSYSPSVFNGLIQKEILQTFAVETGRVDHDKSPTREPYPLNGPQEKALSQIHTCFDDFHTCLLHGVTSSGKTEIYTHLIEQFIQEGKQVLYLVPEIALTVQLRERLQAVFGSKLGIYHSKIEDNERAEIWQKMLSDDPYKIILGVRSSLFLPFKKLGLVIVDEEHETSYKQQDPAPRYHARDTAVMLAHLFKAKTLLGSATPSLETYHNTRTGKYGLVTLNERFNNVMAPRIWIENTRDLRKRKKMKSLLAPLLIEQMNSALSDGEQVILFRNRRGFASFVECTQCAWVPKCNRCDVTLTYHKLRDRLVCHYCNASYRVPAVCPSCNADTLRPLGIGTEQLEEEVSRLFPDSIVRRMDTDTTRRKDNYEQIIDDFQEKRIDILVGTQMLSKGLDFDNVGVVGIISADSLLNYPNFRSHERGFQLMMQAAGRAGRKNAEGRVVIQSADPGQPLYRFIIQNDFKGFFDAELAERKLFHYPPFTRLITVVLKHRNEQQLDSASLLFARLLKQHFDDMVLGPNKPMISRIQHYNIREILLKLTNRFSPKQARVFIKSAETLFREYTESKQVILYYDVD